MCEAIGLYDFTAKDGTELSFKKGTVLKVLNDAEKDWCKAEVDGKEGLVPTNYIQVKDNNFLDLNITRRGAVELLMKDHDGAFLIRGSEGSPGDFTLSVKYQAGVQHFKVLRDGAGKYFLWVVKFNSLNQLVDYHRTSSVSRTQQIYLKDRNTSKNQEIVVAMYDFDAQEEGELSFKKGDQIEVLNKDDPNWWRGKLVGTGSEGMFPVPYVQEKTE